MKRLRNKAAEPDGGDPAYEILRQAVRLDPAVMRKLGRTGAEIEELEREIVEFITSGALCPGEFIPGESLRTSPTCTGNCSCCWGLLPLSCEVPLAGKDEKLPVPWISPSERMGILRNILRVKTNGEPRQSNLIQRRPDGGGSINDKGEYT